MMDAQALIHALGGVWRNGRGQSPCPICQPERRKDQNALSLSERDGKLLLYCFKGGCSFVEIAKAIGAPLDVVQTDFEAQHESQAKHAAYEVKQIAKAQSLWRTTKPIEGTKAEAYLKARGITCTLAETLRFAPDIYHGPSGQSCSAMVGLVSTGGIHRTFFDAQGNRLTKTAKMMMGPCCGGAVSLSKDTGPLIVCEGIETGLSLLSGLFDGPATVWATLSTAGMKSLKLPDAAGQIIIATDGDKAGREAGNTLAERAVLLGWSVGLLPAPDAQDWNDVLLKGATK